MLGGGSAAQDMLGRYANKRHMATDLTRRKLREASFFLGEMSKREGSSRLDTEEEFGYYLSAFLSAARSVSFVLRKENPLTYEAHWDEWLANAPPATRAIMDFMRDQRNAAVHEGTVAAQQSLEHVHPFQAGEWRSGSPSPVIVMPWAFADGATVGVARYVLHIDDDQRPAVEACRDYLAGLRLLVDSFQV